MLYYTSKWILRIFNINRFDIEKLSTENSKYFHPKIYVIRNTFYTNINHIILSRFRGRSGIFYRRSSKSRKPRSFSIQKCIRRTKLELWTIHLLLKHRRHHNRLTFHCFISQNIDPIIITQYDHYTAEKWLFDSTTEKNLIQFIMNRILSNKLGSIREEFQIYKRPFYMSVKMIKLYWLLYYVPMR